MATEHRIARQGQLEDVIIPAGRTSVRGVLSIPPAAEGIVLFAHGSGSSRNSPRNRYVADVLGGVGFGTLLMDLLNSAEEDYDSRTAELRFNIPLLTDRLLAATDWVELNPETASLPIGYFGSSTGAAAALAAAAERPDIVRAIVSRGGRPDLADAALARVQAPTLLVVGGKDIHVLGLNRVALGRISAASELSVVAGAGHLFEERGALEQVAELAREWFRQHLANSAGVHVRRREALQKAA